MTQEYAIPGFPRYALVGEGNDWTVLGPGQRRASTPCLPLKPDVDKRNGRLRFTLCAPGTKPACLDLGRIVLLAFVGPPPPGTECCHGDGDPTNNRIGNLRWDTSSANRLDLVRLRNCGELGSPAMSGTQRIKTTIGMTRQVWGLARARAVRSNLNVGDYVERLILVTDNDPAIEARIEALTPDAQQPPR